jgi:hypothetical protein
MTMCHLSPQRGRNGPSTRVAGADIFGADVHLDVLDVTERQGRTIVRVKVDGTPHDVRRAPGLPMYLCPP